MDSAVILTDLKYEANLASAMRAASNFGCARLYWSGTRVLDLPKHPRPKRGRGRAASESHFDDFKDVRGERVRDVAKLLAELTREGYTPVAVELSRQATSLERFKHPAKAIYLFGPEDGDLAPELMARCHHKVMIPSFGCLNVSQSLCVVLAHGRLEELKRSPRHLAAV